MTDQTTVINSNDNGNGSLRWAIDNALDGDKVTFALDVTEVNLSSPIQISKNITIEGHSIQDPDNPYYSDGSERLKPTVTLL